VSQRPRAVSASASSTVVAPAAELDEPAGLLVAQHAVDGRARGPRKGRQVLLRERHDGRLLAVAVDLRGLDQPPHDALVGRHVQGLQQLARQPPHLGREDHDQDFPGVGMPRAQAVEVQPVHAVRDGGLERDHGGAAACVLLVAEQRELPEHLSCPEHREDGPVAERGRHAHRETALLDQVQGVRRVLFVEDDLAALELPSPRDAQQALDVVRRHTVEQRPPHAGSVPPGRVTAVTHRA